MSDKTLLRRVIGVLVVVMAVLLVARIVLIVAGAVRSDWVDIGGSVVLVLFGVALWWTTGRQLSR